MKKLKIITTTILSLLLIISITSCDKKDEFDPAAPVHEPGRIVTCKIDGKNWSHGDENCALCHSLRMDYYSSSKKLDFDASNFLKEPFHNNLSIYIYIDSVGSASLIKELSIYTDFKNPENCDYFDYYLDTIYNNIFYIEEFNPMKKKIRGMFEFQVISPGCQDTVLITEGYFDLNPYWHE